MIEILELIASLVTPVIILIFGVFINKNLEKSKVTLSKENNWQVWWATKFLEVCHSYSNSVTEIITGLFQLKQIEEEKKSNWKIESEEKLNIIRKNMREIQRLDWEIQNYIQFAIKMGEEVSRNQKELYNLIGELINKRQGDLETIRNRQFQFNKSVREAHAEILELKK